jgi:hypothetical protein
MTIGLREMDVGDWVHNVPHDRYGVIIEELKPLREARRPGNIVERRFQVLYAGGEILLTGCTFLDKVGVIDGDR